MTLLPQRIDRYVVAHIFGLTAIVGTALMSIFSFIAFVTRIDSIGRGRFGYAELFLFTLYQLPNGFYMMLPVIAMLGTLMGLGTLASQSELTAMRAAGVSLMRIGGATLLAGALLGAVGLVVGDWLAPRGETAAESLKTASQTGVAPGLGGGRPKWIRDGNNFFYVYKLFAEDHIGPAEIYTLGPDLQLRTATVVENGRYDGGHWKFTGVKRTEFLPAGSQVEELPAMEYHGGLSPEVLRLYVLESEALSIAGLWRLIGYLDSNHLDTSTYSLALCRKLVAPITIMTMMLFAIPFVLGPLRNAGAGQRLFIGMLIGIGFYVVNEVTANTGQLYGWTPLLSAGAPTAAFAAFALWRLSRAR
jgi:lipopolysaccharide export system permease protein